MSGRRTQALLWDAVNALEQVIRFVAGRSFEDYVQDDMLRSAVERQLEISGEALAALRRVDPALAGTIPDLERAVGMRNVLIHGYASVDAYAVWQTVQEDVPRLHAALSSVLRAAS